MLNLGLSNCPVSEKNALKSYGGSVGINSLYAGFYYTLIETDD